MAGILRRFVALDGIHSTEQGGGGGGRGRGGADPQNRQYRPRRNAAPTDRSGAKGNGAGGQSATTTATTTIKSRTYTSQIGYQSSGGGPGGGSGRIFNTTNGLGLGGGNSTNSTMERERIRMEFYATYDVMTGIRIAATLSGFFALMIVLVMYKSRSHTNQALKDPKIVAVAAQVVLEEEERELQEKLDATGLSLYADDINYEYRRQRLLSLGGFDPALIDSPRRYSYGGVRPKYISRPGSRQSDLQTRYSYDYRDPQQQPHQHRQLENIDDDEFIMVEQDELENEFEEIEFRSYPPVPRASSYDSRRCSSITCCSTESSYLERRCSALTLGIYSIGPNLVHQHQQPPPTPSSASHLGGDELHQLRYPYSISELTAPGQQQYSGFNSMSASSRAIRSNSRRFSGRTSSRRSSMLRRKEAAAAEATDVSVTLAQDTETGGSSTLKRTAPLASLSSFKMSSVEQPLEGGRSLGSDSVFCENYVDTDEEVAQFSSDSCGEENCELDMLDQFNRGGGANRVAGLEENNFFIEPVLRDMCSVEGIPVDAIEMTAPSEDRGADRAMEQVASVEGVEEESDNLKRENGILLSVSGQLDGNKDETVERRVQGDTDKKEQEVTNRDDEVSIAISESHSPEEKEALVEPPSTTTATEECQDLVASGSSTKTTSKTSGENEIRKKR